MELDRLFSHGATFTRQSTISLTSTARDTISIDVRKIRKEKYMARKGSEKRRTGCQTCKKRRVKCDETRPACVRCMSAKRQCGYLEPPVGSFSWRHLLEAKPCLSPPPSTVKLPPKQARSMDYFLDIVAPAIGGLMHSTFWATPVIQVAMREHAAMHGMLAISMLYEGFEPGWKLMSSDEAAIGHYNHALRLIAMSQLDPSVVVIVSVLFTCIEFLRGNTGAAITHCRYGILLSNSSGSRDDTVSAMLRHLSVFPYFFASGEFPVPAKVTPAGRFNDAGAAASEMDDLMGRAVRLVRSLDAYRLSSEETAVPLGTWETQQTLLEDLRNWKNTFNVLLSTCRLGGERTDFRLLSMRCLVCWLWTSIAPHREETASDAFLPEFAQIVELANEKNQGQSDAVKFTFGMGISPLLHFVVIKCRHLSTRLEALESLRRMGVRRESLWDTATMYAIGRCLIEREHGIVVTPGVVAVEGELPGDEMRVRDSYLEEEVFEERNELGDMVFRRKICLFVLQGEKIGLETDWVADPAILDSTSPGRNQPRGQPRQWV